ncbi:MAG TPA: hypothetical protein VF752_08015 [Thermoleophilaceae bacterium]
MNQRGRRLAILVVGVIAIVVAFVVLNSSGNDNNDNKQASSTTSTTATTPGQSTTQNTSASAQPAVKTVVVKNAKPVGGIQKLSFNKGDQVRFRVKSDVGDEIHVHGYDFHKDVKPGSSVTFSFPAKIDGIFIVELESRGEQIASLQVNP